MITHIKFLNGNPAASSMLVKRAARATDFTASHMSAEAHRPMSPGSSSFAEKLPAWRERAYCT